MPDHRPLNRIVLQPQALHFGYEKAGLTLDNQPIPWNAEAVLVEAQTRWSGQPGSKADFSLRLTGQTFKPDSIRDDDGHCRLFFRVPVPQETSSAELLWQKRSLGQLTLPVLPQEDFQKKLTLQMPTLYARLGEQTVACQSYVSSQCEGLLASALLTSPTSLVPILDLGLAVEFRPEDSKSETGPIRNGPGRRAGPSQRIPVQFRSSQLKGRQALITVALPRPRRMGAWQATWYLGKTPLARQRIRAISKGHFQRSLRITDTRFVLQDVEGKVSLARRLPDLDSVARLGPCFLVSSSELGMAGLCPLQVHAQVADASGPPLLLEQLVLISDGPAPFAPGTVAVADLAGVSGFELRLKDKVLGVLPLTAAPRATFSGEGGFKPPADFHWSAAAEDQLKERLGRLLEERNYKT